MAFISGLIARCSNSIFDGQTFPAEDAAAHVVGVCGSTDLGVVSETYDARAQIVVGEQVCRACGTSYLFSRRLTPGEQVLPPAPAARPKGRVGMKLFDVPKVGCYCDAITHSLETRRDVDVKILTLTLRVAPFDAKLAAALPNGVKSTLFNLNTAEPKPGLSRVHFALGVERQILKVAAASDTRTSLALDQVKISGTYARTQKNRNGYDFVFRAAFGPAGKQELEFVQDWLLSQRFVTFDEAEPGMFEDPEEQEEEEPPAAEREQPMFDSDADGKPLEAGAAAAEPRERAYRKPHSHAAGKKGRPKAEAPRGRGPRREH